MEVRKKLWNRIGTLSGLLCLGMTLALLPIGVSAVRAGDGTESLMSLDPLLVEGQAESTLPKPVAPVITPAEAGEFVRPGSAGTEVQPGVIVLNTRGYNYGPPPATIDPAAMNHESPTP